MRMTKYTLKAKHYYLYIKRGRRATTTKKVIIKNVNKNDYVIMCEYIIIKLLSNTK